MQRITYIGQNRSRNDQSGIWSLQDQCMLQQAGQWGYVPNVDIAPSVYTRPTDWLELPPVLNSDEKFVGLFAIFNHNSNFVKLSATSNYVVDWGDGSPVEHITTGNTAQHRYDFNSLDNSTLTTLGYKQAIVTVVPDVGATLTTLNISEQISEYNSSSSSGWLDISLAGPNLITLTISQNSSVVLKYLQQVRIQSNLISSWLRMFYGCSGLKSIVSLNTSSGTVFQNMFEGCSSLLSIPSFDTSNGTSFTSIFATCSSMVSAPMIDTSNATDLSSMFRNCYSLQNVPAYNTSSCTNFFSMFSACRSITTVPTFDSSSVTNFGYMFAGCSSLETVPLFDTSNALSMPHMFESCYSLQYIPQFDISKCTDISGMFTECLSLITIPSLNTVNVTSFTETFFSCISLVSVPYLNTSNGQIFTYMFNNCSALKEVSQFDVSKGTNFNQMFGYCPALVKVPPINSGNGTSFSNMFTGCPSLSEFPDIDVHNGTNFENMFFGCLSLPIVSNLNCSQGTVFSNMFSNCHGIIAVSNVDVHNGQLFDGMFSNTVNLLNIDSMNLSNGTTFSNMFSKEVFGNYSTLSSFDGFGMKYSIDFNHALLSKSALENIFMNCGTANLASQSFNISNNYGADTPIVMTGTITSGSSVISMSDTSNLQSGMLTRGQGISDPVAVTLTSSDSTVNRIGHGLRNNTSVSFNTIVSTSGISPFTIYYVVNTAADSFQVSNLPGGSNIALIGDGSGSVLYPSYIEVINPNVSIKLSAPASDNGSITVSNRLLDTSNATLKGWTIIG